MLATEYKTRTISGNNGCTAGNPLHAMYQNHSVARESFVNEPAGIGQVDQEVCVVDVFNGNTQMPVSGGGIIGRYGLASDRHDMADPAFCEDPRRFGGVNPGKPERVSPECRQGGKIRCARIDSTYVPRNNRPSIIGLMFLQVAMSVVSAVVRVRYRRPEPCW